MRRALTPLLALLALAALADPARCVIYEVADKDGNVTHYKYTDRKGGVVFTDNLAAIPESVRKTNQLVRVGPPPKPKPSAGAPVAAKQQPPAEGSAGTLPSLEDALRPVTPPPAPPSESFKGFVWWMAALAVILGGGAVARKALGSRRDLSAPAPPAAPPVPRGRERPVGAREAPSAAAARRAELPREAIERLIHAGDLAGAAQLCDAQGDLARGAELYLKAGLYAEAAANFAQVGEFARAGEGHLKAGDPEKAAAAYAQAGDPVRGFSALAAYYYDQGDARQAAAWAEKAGDLVQAATYLQEVGELARAGDLFFQGGFHSEAAEIFTELKDLPRAAEALAKAGRPLEAAQALEKSGGDMRRTAELYEEGGGFHEAGRLFAKLGDLERALGALQQIDAGAAEYPQASMLVGMIFLKRGQVALAQEKFAKLIAGRPIQRATLEPYYFLAICHERGGGRDMARAIFEKILAEDYNFRDVKARLAAR